MFRMARSTCLFLMFVSCLSAQTLGKAEFTRKLVAAAGLPAPRVVPLGELHRAMVSEPVQP